MFFRVLPCVDLGTLLGVAEDIGYALRFGIIDPKPDALDKIADTSALEELARKGQAAQQADTERRVAEAREATSDNDD